MPTSLFRRGGAILPGSAFTLLGTNSLASGTASTQALTLTAQINPGDKVWFAACALSTGATLTFSSITNSGTVESWTFDKTQNNATNPIFGIALYRCVAANTHAIGQTITVTTTGHQDCNVAAFKVSPENFYAALALHISNSATGLGTSAAPGSNTPTIVPTFGVEVIGVPGSSSFTAYPGGGWTTRYDSNSTIGGCELYIGTIVKADKAAINNAGSLNFSARWCALQCFYPLATNAAIPNMNQNVPIFKATA